MEVSLRTMLILSPYFTHSISLAISADSGGGGATPAREYTVSLLVLALGDNLP